MSGLRSSLFVQFLQLRALCILHQELRQLSFCMGWYGVSNQVSPDITTYKTQYNRKSGQNIQIFEKKGLLS